MNYEMEIDLILNGTRLKPCDFETEEVVERKGTRNRPTAIFAGRQLQRQNDIKRRSPIFANAVK